MVLRLREAAIEPDDDGYDEHRREEGKQRVVPRLSQPEPDEANNDPGNESASRASSHQIQEITSDTTNPSTQTI